MRRSWKSGWLLAIAVCALPVLTPRPARAQTASEIAQAQDWFKDALSLEQASKWQDALTELRRVAAVKLTPQIGFHLGLCESHVGLLVEARVDLERARDGARAQGLTKVVDAASAELEGVKPRIAHVKITTVGDPPTRVLVDGATIALAVAEGPIPLDPGKHALVVETRNGRAEKQTELREGETVAVSMVPTPTPRGPASAGDTSAGGDSGNAPSRGAPIAGWVLVGVGGAALVAGGIFWALRSSTISTLNGVCGPGGNSCPSSAHGTYDDGQRDTVVSLVLLGAGLGSAIAGAAVLLLAHPSSSHSDDAPAKTSFLPFQVWPGIIQGGAGFDVSGRW